jgi:hypothetical protein
MNTENYYDILGVEETATQEEIKKSYRKLAKENHPDKGGSEDLFKKISVAYDTIGDETKRKQYDVERKNPFGGMGGGYGSSFSDLFNSVFGQQTQQRTHTTNINVSVGVIESFMGKNKTITYKRKSKCEPCDGGGGDSQVCSTCRGQGQVVRQVGSNMFFQMVTVECPTCSGSGKIMINPCHSCGGKGNKDFPTYWYGKDSKITIDRMAERIVDNELVTNLTDQDVRNIIIEIISFGKPLNYENYMLGEKPIISANKLTNQDVENLFNQYAEQINLNLKMKDGLFATDITIEDFKKLADTVNTKKELEEFIKKCYSI